MNKQSQKEIDSPFIIQLDQVTCSLDKNILCENVSFGLKQGDHLTILWKDGLGKSTFMEICTGLLKSKYSGSVKHYGKDIKKHSNEMIMKSRNRTGYVFQNGALISNHTVFDNIALPLRYHSQKTNRKIDEIVMAQIEKYNITDIQFLLPEMLTTSQSKLVAFARALVVEPDILYLDEPSLGLDHESFDFIVDRLKEFAQKNLRSTLLLTKSRSLCQALQFPIAVFNNKKLYLPNERKQCKK
ncbi:toluene ABC transporter ATP-binding protein [Candidatus Magnetomorum sp. HK-1]|nr:toluene ABC transporter ATP-binding protein [Candidatus Magnetomorum sp. HK-1]